jgi:hypothetical protein
MYWLRRLFHKEKTEKQLDSELRFHLEQQTAEYVEAGMDPDQAGAGRGLSSAGWRV